MLFFLLVHSSVNDTISDGLALYYTLVCCEWNAVEAGDTRGIYGQLWCHIVPGILFSIKLCGGLTLESSECNQITRLTALRRLKQLSCVAIWGLCTEYHSVAHVLGELSCLKID